MENNAENFFFSGKGQQIFRNILREGLLKRPVFRETVLKESVLRESGIFRKSKGYLVSGEGREKLKLRSPLIRKLLNSGIQALETSSQLRKIN